MSNYYEYIESFTEDIKSILDDAKCQPILFIGSGFSQRYASLPTWENLLIKLTEQCPLCKPYTYYKQVFKDDYAKIGQEITKSYFDWAWSDGRSFFEEGLFENEDSSIFCKSKIKEIFEKETQSIGSPKNHQEIELLKQIKPHAIITTNYDNLLESIFPDYELIIGNDVFRKHQLAIGEIFKIHGCITEPQSLIFNEQDYKKFDEQHGYLSAKLLTYFIEHPLIFIGYSAQDKNVRKILSDVNKMVQAKYDLIPNIYFLEWSKSINENSTPPTEREIPVSEDAYMKLKSITANEFEWVYKAFESQGQLDNINIKTLRSFMARCYKLVISNIPTKNVNLNYSSLDKAIESDDSFFNFFGFGKIDSPEHLNANYPYTITQLGKSLGGLSTYRINQIIKLISSKNSYDIKESDNAYHLKIKTGQAEGSKVHKYSEKMLALIKSELNGDKYNFEP